MKKQLIRLRVPAANGFTLAEILVAVVIIGIAIAALVGANGAFTQVNGAAVNLSTAEFLIEEIRELTTMSAYDDLHAFANDFCPPVDVSGGLLPDFSSFTQQVTVEYVDPSSLETVVPDDLDFIRITVVIVQNNRTISSASWIRASY